MLAIISDVGGLLLPSVPVAPPYGNISTTRTLLVAIRRLLLPCRALVGTEFKTAASGFFWWFSMLLYCVAIESVHDALAS